MTVVYWIRGWSQEFENNRTRTLKHMEWVPVPNKMDGDGYTELLDHPDGPAHFGVWIALVEVASKCAPRGILIRGLSNDLVTIPQEGAGQRPGERQEDVTFPQDDADAARLAAEMVFGGMKPHDVNSLSRITRMPVKALEEALPRLVSIGWVAKQVIGNTTDAKIPQEGAGYCPDERQGDVTPLRDDDYGTERNGRRDDDRAQGGAAVGHIEFKPDGDELDHEIRQYFDHHAGLMYSPSGHAKVKKLVTSATWPVARECIDTAIVESASDPPAYALKVWANRQAKSRLRGDRSLRQAARATPSGEWQRKPYCPG